MPRWLRPSIRAERVASLKNPTPRERREPVRFTRPPDGAADRLVVRYDRVQLLDQPNDALGMPLGELDTGDEVEVLDREVIWTRVRTPGHTDGWVPAMTLTAPDALPLDLDVAPIAEALDSPNGDPDQPALEDLLAIAARQRALAEAQPAAAQPPVAPKRPRKAPAQATQKPSNKARKTKKPIHRTSARKKRH